MTARGGGSRTGPSAFHRYIRVGGPRQVSAGYSRFVRRIRIVLPVLALCLVAAVFARPWIGDTIVREGDGPVTVRGEDLTDQVMLNMRAVGVDGDRPYRIRSAGLRRVGSSGRRFLMDRPDANLVLEDGYWLAGSGGSGVVDWEEETLRLEGGVGLWHQEGYEIHTATAMLDLNAGTASGDDPVVGVGPPGWFAGRGFRLTGSGRQLSLLGRSTVWIGPGNARVAR